jgi:hypothetical protein
MNLIATLVLIYYLLSFEVKISLIWTFEVYLTLCHLNGKMRLEILFFSRSTKSKNMNSKSLCRSPAATAEKVRTGRRIEINCCYYPRHSKAPINIIRRYDLTMTRPDPRSAGFIITCFHNSPTRAPFHGPLFSPRKATKTLKGRRREKNKKDNGSGWSGYSFYCGGGYAEEEVQFVFFSPLTKSWAWSGERILSFYFFFLRLITFNYGLGHGVMYFSPPPHLDTISCNVGWNYGTPRSGLGTVWWEGWHMMRTVPYTTYKYRHLPCQEWRISTTTQKHRTVGGTLCSINL